MRDFGKGFVEVVCFVAIVIIAFVGATACVFARKFFAFATRRIDCFNCNKISKYRKEEQKKEYFLDNTIPVNRICLSCGHIERDSRIDWLGIFD